jgi:hypothetical protein
MGNAHAANSISQLLRAMDGMRYMPMFNPVIAFFDESGKFEGTEIVCMGGCVVAPELVPVLTREWVDILEDVKLPFTSMKEAVHFKGPYLKWKDQPDKRDDALRRLANVLVTNRVGCIAATAPSVFFGSMSDAEKERLWRNTYYPAFESCIIGCLGHAGTEVRVFCDLAEEYSEKCVKLFHLLRKRRSDAKARCVGISFCDDEVTPCLQMADMVAYCGRTAESVSYAIDPIVSELSALLYSSDRKRGKVLYRTSADGLGDAELVWDQTDDDALSSNQ